MPECMKIETRLKGGRWVLGWPNSVVGWPIKVLRWHSRVLGSFVLDGLGFTFDGMGLFFRWDGHLFLMGRAFVFDGLGICFDGPGICVLLVGDQSRNERSWIGWDFVFDGLGLRVDKAGLCFGWAGRLLWWDGSLLLEDRRHNEGRLRPEWKGPTVIYLLATPRRSLVSIGPRLRTGSAFKLWSNEACRKHKRHSWSNGMPPPNEEW